MSPPTSVVIVGAGQGGFQTAFSLREGGFDGRIVLLGDEPDLPYQRPPLSKAYLTGKADAALVSLRPERFYGDHRIELRTGARAEAIDRATRHAVLSTGERLAYDHLVLATGAHNRALPVTGGGLDGVVQLRSLAEAEALRRRLDAARRVVVVGAGFIGLEFAAVAAGRGAGVEVIEAASRVMARAVSPAVSEHVRAVHEASGIRFVLDAAVVEITGAEGRVTGVATADGRHFPADLVLVGIGVVPNTGLAAEAGLEVANGIAVDEHLLTRDPMISAIGDCAAFPCRHAAGGPAGAAPGGGPTRFGPDGGASRMEAGGSPNGLEPDGGLAPLDPGTVLTRLESVQNAVDQARCVAARLLGHTAPYAALPWFWSDQGTLKLQIAGLATPHDRAVPRPDPGGTGLSVFCFREGRLVGVESVNRPVDHILSRKLLAGGRDITPEQAADPGFDLKARANAAQAAAGRGG